MLFQQKSRGGPDQGIGFVPKPMISARRGTSERGGRQVSSAILTSSSPVVSTLYVTVPAGALKPSIPERRGEPLEHPGVGLGVAVLDDDQALRLPPGEDALPVLARRQQGYRTPSPRHRQCFGLYVYRLST